ncbi:MBL fold metallo-hydrolase [Arvimicrobium flavum]|uniref:MBL fold metallo-hydrolase n=1 Tax=Arvimicrobium flavum TaxID=3393320 RepID=UPI00237B1732|nr:MBL fold metallo-hydrolase [Mesorhizobium shangrilense]
MKAAFTIICATLLGLGSAAAESGAVASEQKSTRLVLLGTAGGPTWYGDNSPHGISSAVIVNGRAYIVDFGSGAYRQLRTAGIKPGSEAALFFTHLHSDHVIDLPSLLMYDPSARKRANASLKIFGPGTRGVLPPLAGDAKEDVVIHPENPSPGTADMVSALVGAFATDMNIRVRHEGIPDVRDFFEAHDVAMPASVAVDSNADAWPSMEPFEVWADENVRVTATLVDHGKVFPNYAYRFDTADGSIVFSGDTAISENLVRLAKDADILVHEAIDPSWIAKIVGDKPWNARQEALAH